MALLICLSVLPGILAEVCLPASALRNLHVVIDGPAREMTVAPTGVLEPRGEPVACRVNPDTGLFLVETMIDGESVQHRGAGNAVSVI